MHKGLSGNSRSHATSGYIVAAQSLGILRKPGAASSCNPIDTPGTLLLALGPAGTTYELLPFDRCGGFVQWCENSLKTCQASTWKWPEQGGSLAVFGDMVMLGIASLRSAEGGSIGFQGGVEYMRAAAKASAPMPVRRRCVRKKSLARQASDDSGQHYTLKCAARCWLLAADAAGLFRLAGSPPGPTAPRSFDSMTMGELLPYLPDQKQQIHGLEAKATAWVRTNYGADPLSLTAHLCFAQTLKDWQLKRLVAMEYKDLAKPVWDDVDYRREHPADEDYFPHTMKTLGRLLWPDSDDEEGHGILGDSDSDID